MERCTFRPSKKIPFPWNHPKTKITCHITGPTRATTPNGIQIRSAVLLATLDRQAHGLVTLQLQSLYLLWPYPPHPAARGRPGGGRAMGPLIDK